ncbi:MAG: hypothetical protein IKY61_00860, partial [Thermoguttaceae bacterium]|nr:hypothetical protein [Thermoguttaceae bacterium]
RQDDARRLTTFREGCVRLLDVRRAISNALLSINDKIDDKENGDGGERGAAPFLSSAFFRMRC